MQIIGRPCTACGEAVASEEGARSCRSCDVILCGEHEGMERCPSCKRPLAERDVPAAPPEPDAALQRGRRQIVAVGVSLVGSVLLVFVLGGAPAMAAVLQVVLMALLLLQVMRGRAWARWVLVAYVGLAAAGNAYQGVSSLRGDAPWEISLALAAVYAWCALVLALSGSVSRFVRAQRLRDP